MLFIMLNCNFLWTTKGHNLAIWMTLQKAIPITWAKLLQNSFAKNENVPVLKIYPFNILTQSSEGNLLLTVEACCFLMLKI